MDLQIPQSGPSLASAAPWWIDPSLAGAQGLASGINAFLSYQEKKRAAREQKRQFDEQMALQREVQAFQKRQYDDASASRVMALSNAAFPALNAAQDWRERLLGMR